MTHNPPGMTFDGHQHARKLTVLIAVFIPIISIRFIIQKCVWESSFPGDALWELRHDRHESDSAGAGGVRNRVGLRLSR